MKKAVIFGGTTEGRQLAQALAEAGVRVVYCVATEYGKETLIDNTNIDTRVGRLNSHEMAKLFMTEAPDAVVDVTHPFAEVVKKEIDNALFLYDSVPFFRVSRQKAEIDYSDCKVFENVNDCVKALERTSGTIFLTTGSKLLPVFCQNPRLKERLIVRVIPSVESLKICGENGLTGKQIIAMQGPFSTAMNRVQLRDSKAAIMVLKDSGEASGEVERINAAKLEGVECFVLRRPDAYKDTLSLPQAMEKLKVLFNIEDETEFPRESFRGFKYEITIAGFGMGFGSITSEVSKKIEEADIIFGAPRMLAALNCKAKKYPYYLAKDIMPVLEEMAAERIYKNQSAVILFSGDTSFYSGAKKLVEQLKNDNRFKVTVLPGISSVSALAAKCFESTDDAVIISTHGVNKDIWYPRLLEFAKYESKIFVLTSGAKDVREIGEMLLSLEEKYDTKYEILAGFNLYMDERLMTISATKCARIGEEGLCTLLIKNKKPLLKTITPGIKDDSFLRNKTPMSKEEIRALSICKLGVTKNAIIYDIGSGSGSVSVELGILSPTVSVYAIEFKEEACQLIQENIEKYSLKNVHLIEGVAPEALEDLPAPTHVFVGGSGGRLEEILKAIKLRNTSTRVVVNAVTIETIAELNRILKDFEITDADTSLVSISKAKSVGEYNILQAQNPVYVVSFNL